MASCRLRSTSIKTSFEAPRRTMEQAFVSLHCVIKVKYSSPIFLISKRPASWPMCDSEISSVREQMVAPHDRAILKKSVFKLFEKVESHRKLSVFLTRRMAAMPALAKKCWAKSEMPFSVMTKVGFMAMMSSQRPRMYCSSSSRIRAKSVSFESSISV